MRPNSLFLYFNNWIISWKFNLWQQLLNVIFLNSLFKLHQMGEVKIKKNKTNGWSEVGLKKLGTEQFTHNTFSELGIRWRFHCTACLALVICTMPRYKVSAEGHCFTFFGFVHVDAFQILCHVWAQKCPLHNTPTWHRNRRSEQMHKLDITTRKSELLGLLTGLHGNP